MAVRNEFMHGDCQPMRETALKLPALLWFTESTIPNLKKTPAAARE